MSIVRIPIRKQITFIKRYHCEVGVYIVIILYIIFMVRRRNKKWIKIYNFNT